MREKLRMLEQAREGQRASAATGPALIAAARRGTTTLPERSGSAAAAEAIGEADGLDGPDELESILRAVQAAKRDAAEPPAALAPYHTLVLCDDLQELDWQHFSALRDAIATLGRARPILLILHSRGGLYEPTMAIATLAREVSAGPLEIVVPSLAKSAATLLCCAADRLHLGPESELGPIDPQHGDEPALGLPYALASIARMVEEHPGSEPLFRAVLVVKLDLRELGRAERSVTSVEEMAVQLLAGRRASQDPADNARTARRLARGYADHDHYIDVSEARRVFGGEVVTSGSALYRAAGAVLARILDIRTLGKKVGLSYPHYVGRWDARLSGFRE